MFIIGIAGGTGSGKTTVVKKLLERLPKSKVALMPQDSYYNDGNDVPIEERQKVNYDHPNAFDWALLRQQLSDLQNGKTIEQPVYDYITSSRQKETITITPKPIILVEGIMAFHVDYTDRWLGRDQYIKWGDRGFINPKCILHIPESVCNNEN